MSRTHDQKPGSLPAPQRATEPVRGEEAANQLTATSGTALPASVRETMEGRFDVDFKNVSVHSDSQGAEAARALGARAFTIGNHIAFAKGEYAPQGPAGQRLIAHELTHVVQQRGASAGRGQFTRDASDEREAEIAASHAAGAEAAQSTVTPRGGTQRIQADEPKKGAPPPAATQTPAAQKPAGARVTFVLRAPDDAYTKDVTDYAKNTLKEKVVEVDNVQEAAEYLNKYAKENNTKVGEIRIIGHGSTTGGVKMTPKGETGRRFVTAQELEQMGADEKLKATAAAAMAEGATVEFWGCHVGGTEQSTKALGSIFHADVKAIEGTLRTGSESFLRQADKGEEGKEVTGQQGKWLEAKSTAEIDSRVAAGNKTLGDTFNKWALARAKTLEADGDLPAQPDDAARIAAVRDLFDRSGGKIKRLEIQTDKGAVVHRSDKKVWAEEFKTKKVK